MAMSNNNEALIAKGLAFQGVNGKANLEKMGLFPTDTSQTDILSDLFTWNQDSEISILEPSIGPADAVKSCFKKKRNDNIHIFGVELNPGIYNSIKDDPELEKVLEADFLNDVLISNKAFSAVFGNPPYLENEESSDGKERQELTFLRKVTEKYIKLKGILVWVIPYHVFTESGYFRYIYNRYDILHVWKFQPHIYKLFKQVVIVARRKAYSIALAPELRSAFEKYDEPEKIPVLPDTFRGTELEHSIEIYPSPISEIKAFTSNRYNASQGYRWLLEAAYNNQLADVNKYVDERVTVDEYDNNNIGRPGMLHGAGTSVLATLVQRGDGEIGKEGEDFHLYRGNVKKIESCEVNESDDGKKTIEKVTSSSAISIVILETDGTITKLQ